MPSSPGALLVAVAFLPGVAVGCRGPRPAPRLTAPSACRASDALIESARSWLSLPESATDTVGKEQELLEGLPAVPARQIHEVRDEATCRRVALSIARARGDSIAYPVSVLSFGPDRYLAWDLAESGRPIFVVYYVLDRRARIISRTPT